MDNLTVIYYTSNQENVEFENKIQQSLLKAIGDLPLISVSQKPINFGKNICVGDVGLSNQNIRRQFQIGAKEANTKFVCAAEADFLYVPEYFNFQPERDDTIYYADNLYVLWHHKAGFRPKKQSEGAIVVNRDYIVSEIEDMYKDNGEWQYELESRSEAKYIFKRCNTEPFHNDSPIVTFKTGNSLHFASPTSKIDKYEIPYWGSAKELRRKYL